MGNEQSMISEPTQNGKIQEKLENGSVNGLSAAITSNGLEINVKNEVTVHQNGEPLSSKVTTETAEIVTDGQSATKVVSEIIDTTSEVLEKASEIIETTPEITETTPSKEQVKKGKEEKSRRFGKLFKKKTDREKVQEEKEKETSSSEDQVDVSQSPAGPQQDTVNQKQESESVPESSSAETTQPPPEVETHPEPENGDIQPAEDQEESNPEENPVMNFFKTLVTTTKTPKKETVGPDATKDQSPKETQPAASITVAQISEPPAAPKGMPAPPPPPPEPPKMETKGDPTTKPVKPSPKAEPKAAAKQPEASKGKSTKDTLSKFFRPKVLLGVKKPKGASASGANVKSPTGIIKESPQPDIEVEVEPGVEVKETSVELPEPVVEMQMIENKIEPPDGAVEMAQQALDEQKVNPSKAGTLEAAAKPEPPPPVQEEKKTASKSSFMSLFKSKGGELKKDTPAPPAAPAEAAPAVKAKEEPKAAPKSSETAVDNKPASAACQVGDDAASVPKKLEKRNSIQLFFKNLGQKRHSTDAGVQTEPMTAAAASEKTK